METFRNIPAITARSAEDWRSWLKENHEKVENVWLIIFKKESRIPTVTYKDSVDEALCFGWIDSKGVKRDESSYYQFYSKRKPKSNWSGVNKAKVDVLLVQGKMEPAGMAMVELAKKIGTWNTLDAATNLEIPDDLLAALQSYETAVQNFEAFPKSTKRAILEWISAAKQSVTRQKRVEETAKLAAQNIRANQYTPKSSPKP
jgi:uncharacterized protein YdeI (YjbR/CyaY-like superfamily)